MQQELWSSVGRDTGPAVLPQTGETGCLLGGGEGPAWGGGSMGLLLACRVGLPRPRSPTPVSGSLGVGLRLGGKG